MRLWWLDVESHFLWLAFIDDFWMCLWGSWWLIRYVRRAGVWDAYVASFWLRVLDGEKGRF